MPYQLRGVVDRKTNRNRNTRSHCDMDGGHASAVGIDTRAWCLAMAKRKLVLFMGHGACRNDCASMFTRAYRLVDITALQPLEFIKLPFAVILAWLIFSEWPGLWTWIGNIFASTVYITQRGTRQKSFSQMPAPARPNYGRS